MDSRPDSDEFRFTGFHMAVIMVVFFGVIIAVNLFMAVVASRSWTGLIVGNSYTASQNFNAELSLAEQQRARGWTSHLAYQGGQLAFTLHDKNQAVLELDKISVALGRPAFEQQDQVIKLERQSDGRYVKNVDLQPGQWAFKIQAIAKEAPFRRDARMTIDASGNGALE